MFLIELQYLVPWDEVQKHVVAHRAFLARYYEAGQLLLSGPKASKSGGVILSLQQDRPAVDELIRHDPFSQHGIARYTVTEFSAVKYLPLLQEVLSG